MLFKFLFSYPHSYFIFRFPSSSTCDNPDIIGKEEDTPTSSPLEIVKENIPLTCHNNSINIPHHHQRTQSTSSNNSGHMIGHGTKRDLVSNVGDISDSAYGGSTEKVPNHVYAEIHGPRSNSKTWFSSPSVSIVYYVVCIIYMYVCINKYMYNYIIMSRSVCVCVPVCRCCIYNTYIHTATWS